MLQSIIGPIAGLAGSWLDAKSQAQAASAKLKLTEAEAKAKIMLSVKKRQSQTGSASWRRVLNRVGKTNGLSLSCLSRLFWRLSQAQKDG